VLLSLVFASLDKAFRWTSLAGGESESRGQSIPLDGTELLSPTGKLLRVQRIRTVVKAASYLRDLLRNVKGIQAVVEAIRSEGVEQW
jgi:hypothetical protein